MLIQSSNVNLASRHDYSKKMKGSQKVTEWQTANPTNCRSYAMNFSRDYEESSLCNNYNAFARNLKQSKEKSRLENVQDAVIPVNQNFMEGNTDALRESTHKVFRSLLELLFLRRGTMLRGWQKNNTMDLTSEISQRNITGLSNASSWTRVTQTDYFMEESEATMFSGTGTAITADGRKIDFGVNFALTGRFRQELHMESMEQYERVLTDPLVINLDSNPTSLSEQTFLFDIDCDGQKEELSMLAGQSGFLALDKNGDGKINDGSELFGTRSGNGFWDLAEYDTDGNGWIDEADEIYDKLKVWVRTEEGKDRLLSLKDADVGAIYLGSTDTQFNIRGAEGLLNGVIRSSGMYLHENGAAGTIQQIDLADQAV